MFLVLNYHLLVLILKMINDFMKLLFLFQIMISKKSLVI